MINVQLASGYVDPRGKDLPATSSFGYPPHREDVGSIMLTPLPAPEPSSSTHLPEAKPEVETVKMATEMVYERRLGDTELSYYLPSRAEGVNDMYLCIDFSAPPGLVTDARVHSVWAILRNRHPLLAAEVVMQDGAYDTASYRYTAAGSAEQAMERARGNMRISVGTKDDVILEYLNGPRLLSKEQPAYLLFARDPSNHSAPAPLVNGVHVNGVNGSHTPAYTEDEATEVKNEEFHFCLCSTHYIGDGMALHKTANQFFLLLGSANTDAELIELAQTEWKEKWDRPIGKINNPIPMTLESKLPPLPSVGFARQACKVDFANQQRKTIGGHVLPRQKLGPRKTTVPTVSFTSEETKRALTACKAHSVTISHVIFALCNLVWGRIKKPGNEDLPTLMYAAANLRSYFPKVEDSHFYLAVTYFNIILPSFLPTSLTPAQTLWLRSQAVKNQMNAVVKSKLFVHRAQETALQRAEQARCWAVEDDAREAGTWVAPPPAPAPTTPAQPKAPSSALLGLSMLGNLDAVYEHKAFPRLALQGLTTGSRQRGGAMLLFAYTFAGKLWLSFGYDENGFDREVVRRFWDGLQGGVREFLM